MIKSLIIHDAISRDANVCVRIQLGIITILISSDFVIF